mmetsp:Transcript_14897/g.42288  ORF Transcript_14897/g.42288 Transcript_14897/m.42288 type:complete len:228 (-) Transcript_14897:29-712(-)
MGYGGGKKGKGKGKKGGFGGFGGPFGGKTGPILEQPPLYPKEAMRHLPAPKYPPSREDCDLLTHHRVILRFWKCSCYFVPRPATGPRAAPDRLAAIASQQRQAADRSNADLDTQMWNITHVGGVTAAYFPAELLLRSQLKIKGKATSKSVLDALKRLESKEKAKGDGGASGKKEATDGDQQQLADDPDDVTDEDFGDDDDLGRYGDFEDGMGDDFEDAGGGDGEAEL